MTTPYRLANLLRVNRAEFEQPLQRIFAQMRLISQNQPPMRQVRLPSSPLCRALNRTEHPALGIRIQDPLLQREPQSIQFNAHRGIIVRANHRNLPCAQFPPELNQMAQNRSFPPRQQHFGPPHPTGPPRGKDNGSKKHVHRARVPRVAKIRPTTEAKCHSIAQVCPLPSSNRDFSAKAAKMSSMKRTRKILVILSNRFSRSQKPKFIELKCDDEGNILKQKPLRASPAEPRFDEVWENNEGKISMDACHSFSRIYSHKLQRKKR